MIITVTTTHIAPQTFKLWFEQINGPSGIVNTSFRFWRIHIIEHLSNSSYCFIEEDYIVIIIVIDLSPSPYACHSTTYSYNARFLRCCFWKVSSSLQGWFGELFWSLNLVPIRLKNCIMFCIFTDELFTLIARKLQCIQQFVQISA